MNELDRDRPMNFEFSSGTADRSPANLLAALRQFHVDTAPRYQPTPDGKTTYCSTFVWDASRALAAEVPHWWGDSNGGVTQLRANNQIDWLAGIDGRANGWVECNEDEAVAAAAQGCPAVVGYRAPDGETGHIALAMPTSFVAPGVTVTVAQAGRHCGYGFSRAAAFGSLPTRYFKHP